MNQQVSGPGAGSSYGGYQYQFLATAWVALNLLWTRKGFNRIIVEPETQEDVAAETVADREDANTDLNAEATAIKYAIQIKYRGKNWSVSGLGDLLNGKDKPKGKRGPAPRLRAIAQLKADPSLNYVLVTNAQIDSELAAFGITDLLSTSTAKTFPWDESEPDAAKLAPRIAVLHTKPPDLLTMELERILSLHAHVPQTKVGSCASALIKEVELRVLGKKSREWTAADIEAIIKKFDGVPAGDRTFVAPLIIAQLEEQLQTRFALLITGASGMGKTQLAYELARRQAQAPDGFEIVHSDGDINLIRSKFAELGAHVFVIHDPWGHHTFRDDAIDWAAELTTLLQKAGPKKRFIVVSRTGPRYQAMPVLHPPITDAEVELKPEHYSSEIRREIMERLLADAQPWQRDWVKRFEPNWLAELEEPLALYHLARSVKHAKSESALTIEGVINQSRVDALANTFNLEVRSGGEATIVSALLLWAYHQLDGQVTNETARAARELARAGGYTLPLDPIKTLAAFERAGWFRPSTKGLCAHPTALSGIERFLETDPAITEDALNSLLLGMVEKNQTARAFGIIKVLQLKLHAVGSAVRDKIEEYLLAAYLRADRFTANSALANLAFYSLSENPTLALARCLYPKRKRSICLNDWVAPQLDEVTRRTIAESRKAKEVAIKFLTDIFPFEHQYDGKRVVRFFSTFGWNFRTTLVEMAFDGFRRSDGESRISEIVDAALDSGADNFAQLIDAALSAWDSVMADVVAAEEERESADQAHFDAEHCSHLMEEPSEAFHFVNSSLESLVTQRTSMEGWKWIKDHPQRETLAKFWAKTLTIDTSTQELDALRSCCCDDLSTYWRALARTGNIQHFARLVEEGRKITGDTIDEWAGAVAESDIEKWPKSEWPDLGEFPITHRLAISSKRGGRTLSQQSTWPLTVDDKKVMPILESEEITGISDYHRSILHILRKEGTKNQKAASLIALARTGEKIDIETTAQFQASKHHELREALLCAVELRGGEVVPLAVTLLADQDYRVRRRAIVILINCRNPEILPRLLPLAEDPSAPVRVIWAKAMGFAQYELAVPGLLRLLHDRRDFRPSTIFKHSWPEHHVAREAAAALGQIALNEGAIGLCIEFLSNRDYSKENNDFVVDHKLLLALANQNDARLIRTFANYLGMLLHVDAEKNSGYPLRYTAAWCLAGELSYGAVEPDDQLLRDLTRAALHNDPRLAGPSILALACGDSRCASYLEEVANADITDASRAIIAEAVLREDTRKVRGILQAKSKAHPVRAILDLASTEVPSPESWPSWLAAHPATAGWLAEIQASEGLNPTIRYALSLRFGNNVPPELKSDDKFEAVQPEPVKTTSLHSLFGGE